MNIKRINAIFDKWKTTKKIITTRRKRRENNLKNVTELIIYNKTVIAETSKQEHIIETFIADSGAMSHMVNLEENMTNFRDAETQVTVGDSRNITSTKRGNYNDYQRRDGKIHRVTLSNTSLTTGLHKNLFGVMRALKKCVQVTQEGETLIH